MKTLKISDLEIEVIAEYDDLQLEGNVIDSGDPAYDAEVCNQIREELNNGNVWAWAQVEVKCTYKGILTASDYLGACSYASEEDFKSGGYYDDMVENCLTELNEQLKALCECDTE